MSGNALSPDIQGTDGCMWSLTRVGVPILQCESRAHFLTAQVSASSQYDYTVQLVKQTKIVDVRRFVTQELMDGLAYKGLAEKELAAVIFAAFAHPSLKFTMRARETPAWYDLLLRLNTPKTKQPTHHLIGYKGDPFHER